MSSDLDRKGSGMPGRRRLMVVGDGGVKVIGDRVTAAVVVDVWGVADDRKACLVLAISKFCSS